MEICAGPMLTEELKNEGTGTACPRGDTPF